jgi:prepilin-type N-terminal cleavage/methylation domain-containing protein
MRCLLFFHTQNCKQHTSQQGFTLIELLTVITLMTLIVSIAMTSYNGVKDQGRSDITKYELTQIRKALIQFRQDSGTHSFPAQGSYDCTDEINGGNDTQANSEFSFPTEAGSTNAEKIAWCQHPANFWMLFEDPLAIGWNPDTKRGWNGPYLQRKDGFLKLSGNTIGLDDIANDVWAIANPYVVNQQFTGVQWSFQAAGDVFEQAGAPYVLLVDITNTPALYEPRLISAGEDGIFENNSTDDCITPLDTSSQALDQVLCLLN